MGIISRVLSGAKACHWCKKNDATGTLDGKPVYKTCKRKWK